MRAGIKGWKELCANIYKKKTLVLKCAESFEMLT